MVGLGMPPPGFQPWFFSFRPAVPCLASAGEATTKLSNIKPVCLLRDCAGCSLCLPTFIPLSVNHLVSRGSVCAHMCFWNLWVHTCVHLCVVHFCTCASTSVHGCVCLYMDRDICVCTHPPLLLTWAGRVLGLKEGSLASSEI